MTFNYQYELCSLFILTCIAIQFLSMKRFPTKTNRLFLGIMLSCIADMIFNITSCVSILHIETFPIWVTYTLNTLFFFFQLLIPVLMMTYVLYCAGITYSSHPRHLALLLPAAILIGSLLVNPLTHHIFDIAVIDGAAVYSRGSLFLSLYANELFYLVTVIVLVLLHRNRLSFKQKETITLFVLIIGVISLIQIILSNILLSGMAMTVSIILMDVILQNPEDMLDGDSRTFNQSALKIYLNDAISRNKPFFFTVVEINGLDIFDRGNVSIPGAGLEASIGKFFTRTAGKNSWVFRLSKTRFFVFARNKEDLERQSNAIIERFKKRWKVGNISVDLLAKELCVSTNTSIQYSDSELITLIDEAMEVDNAFTNDKVNLVVNSTLLAKLRRRHIIEESMRRSVKTYEGLYLCYQPIISTKDSSFISAEALLRYNDPNLGAVSPVEFIPIVEKCGMATYIDTYVITEGCKFLTRHPEVQLLHINLSATEFFHNPAASISEIVQRHRVDPSRICLEITESSAATHPDILQSFMHDMIAKGFNFALDDYGTGFANILQVLKLPFRDIKIDRTLLNENEKCRTFLASAIEMFLKLGLDPVIEGVETQEQLKLVTDLGASTIQGFLFSPPLVEDDFMKFIQREPRKA